MLGPLPNTDRPLVEYIRDRIRQSGPVSFAWFMEQALYHPAHGYYSSGRAAIGRGGDYFTNVSVGPLFGALMATQFAEMWAVLGEPVEFVVVEQGAHDGQLAHDILTAAARSHPRFFAALRYRIVEPFALLRDRQAATLASFTDRIAWSKSLDQLGSFCGVHFSNELVDAMPVHLLRWDGMEWVERQVNANGEAFEFVDVSPADELLREHLAQIAAPWTVGYETEVNEAMLSWIDKVAQKLERGFVVVTDYGFSRDEFYAPHRTSGTLQTRARHRVLPSPFHDVGEADLTAHVEWTSLAEQADRSGLALLGFTDQHHFITGLLASRDGAASEDSPMDENSRRALQTLLHPGLLGMKFQFLVLGKNIDARADLAGLRFARNAREALYPSS